MPRLVRQAPLSTRIKAHLDPWDWLLWLAEELNDDAFEDWLRIWAIPIGIGLNVGFVLARGASRGANDAFGRGADDVFADIQGKGIGWVGWFASFAVYALTAGCCLNAIYTFTRKRHYRLFEQSVDVAPNTPSARRVRVDGSPMSSSPMRFLQNTLAPSTAASRAHPDAEREVWELSIWDPKPFNLTLFTLFSPGHLLLYFSLLPPKPLDPRPSVTVFLALAFAAFLSLQLIALKSFFSQQSKDSSLLHGEVMNEYDTKFVHPSLNKPVRDVGTQTRESSMTPRGTKAREVDIYVPTTIINRGFRTNPNPNYSSHYNPNHPAAQLDSPKRQSGAGIPRSATTPNLITPNQYSTRTDGYTSSAMSSASTSVPDFSSPLKPHHERPRERTTQTEDSGYRSVYRSTASPLRKAVSTNQLETRSDRRATSGTSLSPLKHISLPNGDVYGQSRDASSAARRRETGRF